MTSPSMPSELLSTGPQGTGPRSIELHTTTVGSGPSVLLVHGLDDDSSIWDSTVEALRGDCACTLVDLPGHGRSPEPADPAAYGRDAVLDALDEVLHAIGPSVLVGHSLGGYLGLAHHLIRPGALRGLVLVSAGPGFRDREAMTQWNDRVRANSAAMRVTAEAAAVALHTDSVVINGLGKVSIPVGLMVGAEDRAFFGANDYMERKIADVRRRTVIGARHRLMRTHPEAIADMVRSVVAVADWTPSNSVYSV